MNKFIEISTYTFTFHILCYVLWLLFVVPVEGPTDIESLGSLAYLPHAGRVLPVIFFGWQAIPAIFAAELLEWEYLWQGQDFYRTTIASSISCAAVLVAWFTFRSLGVDLQYSKVLSNTNWKHVSLFIIFVSLLNGLGNGGWYALVYDQTDALISIRFLIGDIVGATIMLTLIVVLYPLFMNFKNDRS